MHGEVREMKSDRPVGVSLFIRWLGSQEFGNNCFISRMQLKFSMKIAERILNIPSVGGCRYS